MKLENILTLLATLGAAQAVVNATFSYEVDCDNLLRPETPYPINDDSCIVDVGNAKSFYMSRTQKHRTICLEKYQGERCKEAPVKQQYDWSKSEYGICMNIDVIDTLGYGSYKFKLNGC